MSMIPADSAPNKPTAQTSLFSLYFRFFKTALFGGWGVAGMLSTLATIAVPIATYFWQNHTGMIVLLSALIPFTVLAVCVIVGPLMAALRAYQQVRNELEEIKCKPPLTQLEIDADNKRREIRRWFESGDKLLSAIDACSDDMLPNELTADVVTWFVGADKHIASTFSNFVERFRSEEGFPSRRTISGQRVFREQNRYEVYRRVERLKELYIKEGGHL